MDLVPKFLNIKNDEVNEDASMPEGDYHLTISSTGQLGTNDGFVRRRLRAILLVRNKKKNCFGKNINAHRQYPNTYFEKLELFTSHEAWVVACQSR